MKAAVVWTREADEDLMEARAWYDRIRPDLANRFAKAVVETIESIAENPRQFPVIHRGRRRAGVWRFPYGIFFDVQEDRVVVIGCMHGRRDPKSWQGR